MIYLDHAATSWPKPGSVTAAVTRAMSECGNPGRGGHPLALAAGRTVLGAREAVAELLGISDPACVAFTRNATEALNLALKGLVRPGDHVAVTPVEHNSVMRPLRAMQSQGVHVTMLPSDPDGMVNLARASEALRGVRLVVACHASNVLGTLQPIAELGEMARQAGAMLLVDAAQTAGSYPIDLSSLPVDLMAFPGHKGLLGPQGTGALYMRPGLELAPLIAGGTGSLSELEEMPEFAPDRYEAGTPNVPGLAGLAAACQHLRQKGIGRVRDHELRLTEQFLEGLRQLPFMKMLGPKQAKRRAGLVSLNLRGVRPDVLANVLEERYGICTRTGLHCAPAAHRYAGTWPDGAVRFSFGLSTTDADVDQALKALEELAGRLEVASLAVRRDSYL